MEWLRQSGLFVLILIVFVGVHLFGHGRHGGHGGDDGHSDREGGARSPPPAARGRSSALTSAIFGDWQGR